MSCAISAAQPPAIAPTAVPLEVAATPSDAAAMQAAPSVGERVTITFAAPEEEYPIFEPLIAKFEVDNPGLHVQLVNIEQAATTITLPGGGEMTLIGPESIRKALSLADTVTGMSPTPEAITKGWVHDLTPLIDADPTFDRSDFYPNTLTPDPSGQIFTVPVKQYIDLLAYNKDLWDARGLPAPKPDWSWGDIQAAAEQLARKRGATIEVYGMADWDLGLPGLRAELADAGFQRNPTAQLRLDDPVVIAALERLVALAKAGVYSGVGDFRQLILHQQVGIWPATPNMLADDPNIRPAIPSFGIGIVPRPGGFGGVLGYLMSGGTQHPKEAWRWLAFLSHQVTPEPYANANPAGVVPARSSVAEQSGYWKQLDTETATLIRTFLNRHPSSPTLPDFGLEGEAPIRAALQAALSGAQTPAAALRQAQAALVAQLAQATITPIPGNDQIVVAPPAPIAQPGAITITFGVPGSNDGRIEQIAQAFNQHSATVFVQIKHPDLSTGRPTSVAELARQTDCFIGGVPDTSDIPQLHDLQPLLDADPAFTLDDYFPIVLAQFQRDHKLYGLPYGMDLRALNYNPTAFDRAGLAYPTEAWTVEDFARAARQLARGTGANARYGFASTFLQWRDIFFFLERFGVSATTGAGSTSAPNFTDPQLVQAIYFYLDLLRTTSPHTQLGGYRRGQEMDANAAALVASGRVGMWFDFGAAGTDATPGQGFTHAIAPPPFGHVPPTSNDVRVSGLAISAQSQQPEACWAWLKALSGEIASLQGAFPARISLAESDAFTSQASPGAADVYKAYRAAFQRPLADQGVEPAARSSIDYYWFLRAIDHGLQGEKLEGELAEAQQLTEQLMSCMREGTDGNTCAMQVDADYQGWRYMSGSN